MKKLIIFFIIFFVFNLKANEVQIIDEVLGDGLEVTNHSKVSVHYIGRLEDNNEFDNSYKRNQPFQFQIGVRQVILGWETGLLGMKEGGKRTIFIPYKLAYGESGAGDLIPPKSNLIFEIEILKVVPPKYIQLDSYQLKLAMSDNSFTILDIRNSEEIDNSGIIPGSKLLTACCASSTASLALLIFLTLAFSVSSFLRFSLALDNFSFNWFLVSTTKRCLS